MVVMIMSVALTVPYLAAERFGVWMTIASFASLLTFLDLGVGNALTNHVARTASRDDPALLRQTIGGGLASLAIIGVAVGGMLCVLAAWLPWGNLIKVDQTELLSEARTAVMFFAILYGMTIFTNGLQRVFAGLQSSFEGHVASALGSLAAVIGVWFAAKQQAGIPVLLGVTFGSQSAASLLLLRILYKRRQLSLSGLLTAARVETPVLLRSGGLFLVLQLGTMVGWGADSLIISSTLGAAQVAVYSVTQRLFQFISQPLALLNAPLWGAYADAHVRHDKRFIRSTLQKSISATLGLSIIGVVIILIVNEWLIDKWTSGQIVVPILFISIFAVWTVLETSGNAFAMFLNGVGEVRLQVISTLLFCAIALPLKFFLVVEIGIAGIIFATIIAYLITPVGLYGILFWKKVLRIEHDS